MKNQTIVIEINSIEIAAVGRYYPELPATRTEPPEAECWEWEECLIGGVSVLGADFIDWESIEKKIIADINWRAEDV